MSYVDKEGLAYLWQKIKTALAGKQNALIGQPGQVVGFDGMGLAYAVRGWSNPNLLDNWYFPDPINQRGIVSGVLWGGYSYGIDRWMSFGADVTKWVDGQGIYLMHGTNSLIDQRIEQSAIPVGSTITLSALVDGQLISMTTTVTNTTNAEKKINVSDCTMMLAFKYNYNSLGVCLARIWRWAGNRGVLVKAAKLEFGVQQTLAYQDENGNWVLNDPPPNYALELAKCLMYQYVPSISGSTRMRVINASANYLEFVCHIPTTLRAKPSLVYTNHFTVATMANMPVTGFSFSCTAYGRGWVNIVAAKNGHGLADGQLIISGGENPLIFDSNL